MKAFLMAGILACVFCMSACQSSKDDSSSDDDKGKGVADSQADSLKFLAQLNEIQKIATEPTSSTAVRNEKALAKIREFNKAYPVYASISRDSIQKVFKTPMPKHLNRMGPHITYDTPPANSPVLYGQLSDFEELIPNVYFPADRHHLTNSVTYFDDHGLPTSVLVIDRGYLGGWVRAAHWYYLRRHFIGADRKPYFYDEWKFKDNRDANGKEILNLWVDDYGHSWAGWHTVVDNPYQKQHHQVYNDRNTGSSYWKDRWEVVIEKSGAIDDFKFTTKDIFNPACFNTVR